MNENKANNGTSKRRKALSATLAIAMVLTMLLSGTLAYYYSSRAINTFAGARKEVIAHDDFEEGVNKDIYVENTGGTAVYVRVKLTEDLTMTDAAGNETTYGSSTATKVHGTISDADVNAGNTSTDHQKVHQHFIWTMGSEADQTVLSANDTLFEATSDNGNGIYLDAEKVAHDNYGNGVATGTEKLTAKACKVITMTEYNSYDYDEHVDGHATGAPTKKGFVGWVFDSSGWYYWSQMVEPGQPTGFLLDNVAVRGMDDYAYTYNINVEYQAVDNDDIGIWTNRETIDSNDVNVGLQDQASADAQMLLDIAGAVANGEDKPQRLLLLEKIADAEEAGSEGAAALYQAAYNKLYTSVEELRTVEELIAAGDDALANLAANQVKTVNGEYVVELDSTTKEPKASCKIHDKGLAQALVHQYGDEAAGTLTYDQALAVGLIELYFSDNKTGYPVTSFADLSLNYFPTLCAIDAYKKSDIIPNSNILDSIKSDAEDNVKANLRAILLQEQTNLTGTIDLSAFENLMYVNFSDCSKLEGITLPEGAKLQGISVHSTDITTLDLSQYKDIEYLIVGAKLERIDGLNTLKKIRFFNLVPAKDVSGKEIVGSALTELDLSAAENLAFFNIHQTSVKKVQLSEKAFSTSGTFRCMDGFVSVSPGFAVLGSCLPVIDISQFTHWAIGTGISLQKNATNPPVQVVIRRTGQKEFTNYPAADVYEKIVGGGADGADKYVLHKADGTIDDTLSAETFNEKYDAAIATGGLGVKTE